MYIYVSLVLLEDKKLCKYLLVYSQWYTLIQNIEVHKVSVLEVQGENGCIVFEILKWGGKCD